MFNRKTIVTEDGSSSLYVEVLDEHYHSIHGAVQESKHVFIDYGLKLCQKSPLSILEIGFGTGLIALLTLLEVEKNGIPITYHSLEKYPLQQNEYMQLNFCTLSDIHHRDSFITLHTCVWDEDVVVHEHFKMRKINIDLLNWQPSQTYDLVYFDAFSPEKQPDLWTIAVFKKMYDAMNDGGILTTYCAKGQVKRNLKAAGFLVESKPGPPGKREMTVARKA